MRSLWKSLRALATAGQIYKLLPGATINLGVTARPRQPRRAVRIEDSNGPPPILSWDIKFKLLPIDRGSVFSCIASFESGSFSIDPSDLGSVMAIAVGGSIYIAAPLLCDPSERPLDYEVKRVRGNIGKPGMALMIPPQNPRVRGDVDEERWCLVNHDAYDGRLEDSFRSTTMNLWFTDYIMPINVGNRQGARSFEVCFLESVVSIHDKGTWVAYLDVLKNLDGFNGPQMESLLRIPLHDHSSGINSSNDCVNNKSSDPHNAFRTPVGHYRFTSMDNWNEIIDKPEHVGIVRSYGNWLGRLATASLSAPLGCRTFILPPESDFCWSCVVISWINRRQDHARLMNAAESSRMDVGELLQLMAGLIYQIDTR